MILLYYISKFYDRSRTFQILRNEIVVEYQYNNKNVWNRILLPLNEYGTFRNMDWPSNTSPQDKTKSANNTSISNDFL